MAWLTLVFHKRKGSVLIPTVLGVSLLGFAYLSTRLPYSSEYHRILKLQMSSKLAPKTSLPQRKHPVLRVCPEKMGRFGNLLFEFASAYGIARSVNRTLVVPRDDRIRKVFKLTSEFIGNRSLTCRKWKNLNVEFIAVFDESIFQRVAAFPYDVVVKPYLQSWKYFERFKSDIVRELTLHDKYSQGANNILFNASKTFYPEERNITFIGIHVRRGALKMQQSYDVGYNVATGSYIRDAVKYMTSKYRNTLFIVCSVDGPWIRNELKPVTDAKIHYVYNDAEPELDFAVLVACNHTIMTVGSFGWWAGYLARGDVIYYKYPAWENSKLWKQYNENFTDYFPPYWIGMG